MRDSQRAWRSSLRPDACQQEFDDPIIDSHCASNTERRVPADFVFNLLVRLADGYAGEFKHGPFTKLTGGSAADVLNSPFFGFQIAGTRLLMYSR